MTNYYHLTKKELSFISRIDKPILSPSGCRLSRPIVLVISRTTGDVVNIYTLSWFRYRVKKGPLDSQLYDYQIRCLF